MLALRLLGACVLLHGVVMYLLKRESIPQYIIDILVILSLLLGCIIGILIVVVFISYAQARSQQRQYGKTGTLPK